MSPKTIADKANKEARLKKSLSAIYEKYHPDQPTPVEPKPAIIVPPVQKEMVLSRAELMLIAKKKGIKNFRILNKAELVTVTHGIVSQVDIQKIIDGAVARWKSGWGTTKKETI
jgi:hypothetical protein